jgi:hypothetical protein
LAASQAKEERKNETKDLVVLGKLKPRERKKTLALLMPARLLL